MIPIHEDLGNLVTTPTTWHRRVHFTGGQMKTNGF